MQQYDDDPDVYVDRTRVLSDTHHTARKTHFCDGCECVMGCIAHGQRYRQTVMLDDDGRFIIVRRCLVPGSYPSLPPSDGPVEYLDGDPDDLPW